MSQLPISFEFFPPRDEDARQRLVSGPAAKLNELGPSHFSVTYGAGGSTRDGTIQTVNGLLDAGYDAAPHLSLGNDSRDNLFSMLDDYVKRGVTRIVALRGDQPSGFGANRFAHNAEALIKLIREHSGDHFQLAVAAYPEIHPDSHSAADDLHYFKRKVDAGANSAITQYFYNVDAYANFLDRCGTAGIDIPIVPGIMPITNFDTLVRFSEKAGAEIPRWLTHVLADLKDDEKALTEFGIEFVTELCERLIGLGAPGLHFYTLNRWGATTRICNNLFGD